MISGAFGAIAYLALAFAVNDLFVATENSVPLWRKRVILAVVLTGAVLQAGIVAAAALRPQAVPAVALFANLCLLALPVVFWPVIARLRLGRLRILNTRLTQRAERAEAAAAAARKWLDLAEQSGHVGHWQLTVPDNRLIWSDEMYRIHGLWREHYRPRIETALSAFHPLDGKRVGEVLQEAAAHGGNFEVAARLRRPDGEIRHVILRGNASLDALTQVDAIYGVMADVTEPKRQEAKFHAPPALRGENPFEDTLTGLVDRVQFDNCLAHEFKRAVRSHKPLGMVLVEIDQFAELNAFYGEMEGDACLRAVAQAVQTTPRRTGDVVARYEGAQIAVLLPLADGMGAQRVAQKILETIRALGLPNAGHESGVLSVSCGASAFLGPDDLYDPLELPRRAARALAGAKAAGGNRAHTLHTAELLEALAQRA